MSLRLCCRSKKPWLAQAKAIAGLLAQGRLALLSHHPSIMVAEIVTLAAGLCGGQGPRWIVDGTLGDGGHSLVLLQRFQDARLLALDQDPEMLARAQARLLAAGLGDRVELLGANFRSLPALLRERQLRPDLVLLDLGVSMFHFRGAGRGFSYSDESLDMRLDPSLSTTAAELLNHKPEAELKQIFSSYGEERFAGRIARRIVESRPIQSATTLADLIRRSVPHGGGHGGHGIHPATRVFQALRIVVNDELGALGEVLADLPECLAPGGILTILSFHSLEDRPVKQRFQALSRRDGEGRPPRFVLPFKKALRPQPAEVQANPASRSAKLRALQRLADTVAGD